MSHHLKADRSLLHNKSDGRSSDRTFNEQTEHLLLEPCSSDAQCSHMPTAFLVRAVTSERTSHEVEASHAITSLSKAIDDESSDDCESQSSAWSNRSPSLIDIKISYDMTPSSSTVSSLHPVCKICQNPGEKNNSLVTPCRCDGTLKHVHGTCLRKWIEMRSRRRKCEFPNQCELCGYLYKKRKFIKCRDWRHPKMNSSDKILHTVFLLSLVIMIVCTVMTIQSLMAETSQGAANKYRLPNGEKSYLTVAELTTLSCGIVFFITFILAMTVEIKAKHTIYEVIKKIILYNTVWVIQNYDKELDIQNMSREPPSKVKSTTMI